ncbi:A disintegrin and metalloproteinase with thrombospondin motifs 16 [Lates japonicus]|uniref:A disintegrin and metalloproteinase with thrombospondin motifs 16 n=1 Tax=Lates japonicus TaxID=270547 RepID=A0AAD3MML7_LATJO|nr:A disintegrin and metalloproteinase with thrombospondin motifs 16 [Lates japonicus]
MSPIVVTMVSYTLDRLQRQYLNRFLKLTSETPKRLYLHLLWRSVVSTNESYITLTLHLPLLSPAMTEWCRRGQCNKNRVMRGRGLSMASGQSGILGPACSTEAARWAVTCAGSTAVPDACGVCKEQLHLQDLQGQYTKQHYTVEYYGIGHHPSRAPGSIRVMELNTSRLHAWPSGAPKGTPERTLDSGLADDTHLETIFE